MRSFILYKLRSSESLCLFFGHPLKKSENHIQVKFQLLALSFFVFINLIIIYLSIQAHGLGVCHGDIKLENIMLSSWGWLLLTDFAPFKPTYLPEDNPADYSYFFDTSRYLLNFLNSISIDCSCRDLDKSIEQPKRCFEVIFVRKNYIPIHAIVIFSSKHNPYLKEVKNGIIRFARNMQSLIQNF